MTVRGNISPETGIIVDSVAALEVEGGSVEDIKAVGSFTSALDDSEALRFF